MNKGKSSKSGGYVASLGATSKTLVIQAKVLNVNKSNGNTIIAFLPEVRSLGFSTASAYEDECWMDCFNESEPYVCLDKCVATRVYNDECYRKCYIESDQSDEYGCYVKCTNTKPSVYSISPSNVDRLVKELNGNGYYTYWQAMIQKDGETKVCNVKNAKSATYNGKICLELLLSTKNFGVKGATARKAIDLDDINKGGTFNITMFSNTIIPIPEDQSKIIDYVEKTSSLSTLETALKAAGLDEALSGTAAFTLFAPNNDAFKELPDEALSKLLEIRNKEELKDLLKGHVVQGRYKAFDLVKLAKKGGYLTALNGDKIPLKLRGNKLRIGYNGAQIALPDIGASNGIVHILKKVLVSSG